MPATPERMDNIRLRAFQLANITALVFVIVTRMRMQVWSNVSFFFFNFLFGVLVESAISEGHIDILFEGLIMSVVGGVVIILWACDFNVTPKISDYILGIILLMIAVMSVFSSVPKGYVCAMAPLLPFLCIYYALELSVMAETKKFNK